MKVFELISKLAELAADGAGDAEVYVRISEDVHFPIKDAAIDKDADCILEFDL